VPVGRQDEPSEVWGQAVRGAGGTAAGVSPVTETDREPDNRDAEGRPGPGQLYRLHQQSPVKSPEEIEGQGGPAR